MVAAVQNKLTEIKELCETMGVASLHLFGSGARVNDFSNDSDLDFLYRFKTDESGLLLTPYDYFDLLFGLEEITKRNVDLVAADKVSNDLFLKKAMAVQIKIYEA